MNFVYILICLSLISHTVRISVVQILIENLNSIHLSCIQSSPPNLESLSALHALVCGQSFSAASDKEILIASGLIHLFVVSGGHLTFLKKSFNSILEKLCNEHISASFVAQLAILGLLFFYCAVCNFNAPVVRSFISLFFIFALSFLGLRWRLENLVLISGLSCLVLAPEWTASLSLQMNWIAALTVVVIYKLFRLSSRLFKSSLFYFQFLGAFNFLGFPSLLSIGVVTVAAPLLANILFPLGLLVYAIPQMAVLFDFCIHTMDFVLNHLELHMIFRPSDSEKLVFINWVFIFSLHFFLMFTKAEAYE